MSKTNPPDGWAVSVGTWGTNVDHNIPAAPQAVPVIGDSSLKFSGSGTVSMFSDYIPVLEVSAYKAVSVVQADSLAAGNLVGVRIFFYDSSKVFLSLASGSFALVSAINTWEHREDWFTTPLGAAFARVEIGKIGGSYNMWADYAGVRAAPSAFESYRSAALTLATGWQKLPMDVQAFDYGNIFSLGFQRFEAPYDGIWHFDARARTGTITIGKQFEIALYKTPSGGAAALVKEGDSVWTATVNGEGLSVSVDLKLGAGDYVEPYFYNGDTVSRGFSVGQSSMYFSGHEIR